MYRFALTISVFLLGAVLGSPAAATKYLIAGTFVTQSGSSWSALSGGSFSGWFNLDDNLFPMGANTSKYLFDAGFRVDIFNASGSEIAQLSNTPSQDTYLQIASTYDTTYHGLRIFFRVSRTDYLQMVVPLDFDGNGNIKPDGLNYALVLGSDYADLRSGTVTPLVPEPASWALMLSGFAAIGAAMRRKPGKATVRFSGL